MLRLFARGHREEAVFGSLLRRIGCDAWLEEDGKQYKCSDVEGHFGGSLDGVLKKVPDIPLNAPCLAEFKTHGDKSYKALLKDGLVASKYQHYVQMQIYMHKKNLEYGLYCAVNKNDDSLFMEIVRLDRSVGEQFINRSRDIIYAKRTPKRLSESPGYYKCKFCDYSDICHFPKAQAEKNCRTCEHSFPVKDGKWDCAAKALEISKELMVKGCEFHEFIEDFKG
jgi:hypothetical protein